jgi:hypothetical protein
MERPGDTQAIRCVDPHGSPLASRDGETHESIFAAASARIDAIAREWAQVLDDLGQLVGPAAEQLPSPSRIQGPMATAPITF